MSRATLTGIIKDRVMPGAIVSTDELASYNQLAAEGYRHGKVKHGDKEYAVKDETLGVVHHVNGVENFWRLFKLSIRSTHVHVSAKYMQSYLGEFTFWMNRRRIGNAMFDLLLASL